MRESLRTLIFREAGEEEGSRLDLLRHLVPRMYIAGGYDFSELREVHTNDAGSEYVSASWPEVPVQAPLTCIVIRPFIRHDQQGSPYEMVAEVAGHLRDVLTDAVLSPDYDGIIRHVYIEPEHMASWSEAAQGWKTPQEGDGGRPVNGADTGPMPLTTGDIAFCFSGLRWNEQEWKKPLGDKPKWLQFCQATPGQRGVSATRWNPVYIAGALVRKGHITARRARACFQTQPLLAPWLEAWKTYEADNFQDQ